MDLAVALQEFEKLQGIAGGVESQFRNLATKASELAEEAAKVSADADRVRTQLDRSS